MADIETERALLEIAVGNMNKAFREHDDVPTEDMPTAVLLEETSKVQARLKAIHEWQREQRIGQ